MKVVLFSLNKKVGLMIIRQDMRNQDHCGGEITFVHRHIMSCCFPDYSKDENTLFLRGYDYDQDTRHISMGTYDCVYIFKNLLLSAKEEVVCLERLSL